MATLFSDFLTSLGVPHTADVSDKAFTTMPFKSLFGFSRLLKSYGIDTRTLALDDKETLREVQVPFVAETKDGFVIITEIASDGTVYYRSFGNPLSASLPDFSKKFSGVVLQAFPAPTSTEPGYRHNRLMEIIGRAKTALLIICLVMLFGFGVVAGRLYESWGTVALLVVDIAGLVVTGMLLMKSLNIKSRTSDRICSIIQEHGCDTVLQQKASSFFGIFSWSEVGVSYFAVSTLILLLFPSELPLLALINACCLPFTFWSIWYQRFRIHAWCTLCVITQGLLWLQFGSYIASGVWLYVLPIDWLHLIIAGAAYVVTLMGLNRVVNFIKSLQ